MLVHFVTWIDVSAESEYAVAVKLLYGAQSVQEALSPVCNVERQLS